MKKARMGMSFDSAWFRFKANDEESKPAGNVY